MAAGHVYHWKHGWIPLTYFAALQKAHGSRSGAISYLHASNGIHGSESIASYRGGIHTSEAAQNTARRLRQEGLGLGSTIYWKHPGTGAQAEVKIVGIEHTGHIIVSHSKNLHGERNALIGHSTWSKTPHPNTTFHRDQRGEFINPHVHTRVLEQENGVPMAPPGHPHGRFPRQTSDRGYGPVPHSGINHVPPRVGSQVHEPRIGTKPELTPKVTHTPLPHEFTKVEPRSIVPGIHIGSSRKYVEASKIRQAYTMGHHKVLIQANMTKGQTDALLNDIRDTLHTAHPTLKDHPVTFLVPTGDRHFRPRARGTVLGYVVQGGSTIHINPKLARGDYQSYSDKGHFMPAHETAGTRRWAITHELGHVVDNFKSRTHEAGAFHEGVQLFMNERAKGDLTNGGALSKYGSTSVAEGYAEMFAQHQLGNKSHGYAHTVAQKYAQVYGWERAVA